MAITKETQPYELLVRWKDGALVGAHTIDIEVIKDGSEVISEKPANAKAIDPAQIASVYSGAQALADSSRLLSENVALKTDLETVTGEKILSERRVGELERRLGE